MDLRSMSVSQRVRALVQALNGARRTNEALARCSDGEQMLDVLLDASAKLGLGLTREQLASTPPIRDWIWWKNKEALLTIGDNKPRYQQDGGQGRRSEGRDDRGAETAAGAGESAAEGEQPRRRFLGLF